MGRAGLTAASAVAVLVLTASCSSPARDHAAEEPLPAETRLLDHVGRDPLLALWVRTSDPAAAFDSLLDLLHLRPGGPVVEIRDRVLSRCGPGIALVVDAPVLDELMALSMQGSPEVATRALSRSGLIVETPDAAALDAALSGLFRGLSARMSADGRLRRARLPLPAEVLATMPALPPGELSFYWTSSDGRLALGFDPEWVRRSVGAAPPGARLRDGDDFRRSFPRSADTPASLLYLNLPRLRTVVEGSTMVQVALAAAPGWKRLWDGVTRRIAAGAGFGQLTVRAGEATVRASNAPRWVPGFDELVVALAGAVPSRPSPGGGIEGPRLLLTLRDMRAVGAALDAWASDHRAYPVAESLTVVEGLLVPGYLAALPARDRWGRPFRLSSAQTGFAICSAVGRRGRCPPDGEGVVLRNGAPL